MKKTITVTLNSVIFTLEEDAYQELQRYLDGIKEYFSEVDSSDTAKEILLDIEASVAEKFSTKLSKSKQVINLSDVKDLIRVMGTVADIAQEEGNGHKKDKSKKTDKEEAAHAKKLYRNPDDIIIAGVCSGLATYFGIDPVIIRLIFVVAFFFGGAGLYAYLILWLIMPMAKTTSQKLEMEGAPVTLKKLESLAKDKAREIKQMNGKGVKKLVRAPLVFLRLLFKALGNFIRKSSKGIAIFFGVIIIVSAVLAITAVGFAAATMAFNINAIIMPEVFPLLDVIGQSWYYLGLTTAFVVIFIPLLFLLLIGASLAGRRSAFNAVFSSLLVGIWMIAVITLGVVLIDVVPRTKAKADEIINTETITKDFAFEDVSSLRLGVNGQVKVIKGDEFKLAVTGPEAVINELQFSQDGGELKLLQPQPRAWCLICPEFPVAIEIEMPELQSLVAFRTLTAEVSGFDDQALRVNAGESARVKVYVQGGDLVHYIAGTSGRIEIIGSPETLKAVLEGAGRLIAQELDASDVSISSDVFSRVTLAGKTDKLTAELAGSARLSAHGLIAEKVEVKTVDHTRAEVYPVSSLDAFAEDNSRISYQGSPATVNKNSSENGVIEAVKEFELERLSPMLEGKVRIEAE